MSVEIDRHAAIASPPLPSWSEGHTHSVQFYSDDAFLLSVISRDMGAALATGDAGIVIATRAHREGLARLLHAQGIDVEHVAAEGRYISLDAAETLSSLMDGDLPDPVRFAARVGALIADAGRAAWAAPRRVLVFGEMVALLWAAGRMEAALRLEQLWNDLARTHVFSLLCAYPLEGFRRETGIPAFDAICAAHDHVLPAEKHAALAGEHERLRNLARLQQQAQALDAEVVERRVIQEALQLREQALRDSNEKLREALAARTAFLSIAAHELKTPITSLRAFAQLLLRDLRAERPISEERLEAALTTIDLQSKKLQDLVTRLLDSARIGAGTLPVEPVETDLVALVRAVLAQQPSDGHTFIVDGSERLSAVVDPVRFEQAIANLVDNAVRFSPQGGVVRITLRRDSGGDLEIAVTDHGIGIAPEERQHVFDGFHRSDDTRHLSGMGLGLHITRQIVELHGGTVRIEEPDHEGTRFVVALPAASAHA